MDLPPDQAPEHPEEAGDFAAAPEPEPKKKVRRLRRRQMSDSSEGPVVRKLHPSGRTARARSSTSGALAALDRAPAAIESDDPLVGSVVDGKYKVLEPIGSGGMSSVYKAWHLMLEKHVALKFIKEEASQSVSFREKFFREARIACELRHKNVVQALEFGETPEGKFFILMDYCPGRSLVELITEEKRLEPRRAAHLVAQILDALDEAHGRSIVHRDVKPSNIMVGEDDTAWLLDFGLAKSLDRDDSDTASSKIGALVGTPHYMSPEQAEGKEAVPLSDVYAAGAVLYELVSGLTPFEGAPLEQLRARIADTAPPPSKRVEGLELPPAFERALMRALAREQDDRWPGAAEFRDALRAFSSEGEVDVIVPVEAEAFTFHSSLELAGADLKVHRVRHRKLDSEGLVWIAPKGESVDPGRLAEFRRRLELAKRVEHHSLAPVVEGGPYAGERLYAFTRWQEGPSLREKIKAGPTPAAELAGIATPLLEGLAKAHEFGLTHQAIDPKLVTLGEEGPTLHGLGVVAAANGEDGDPSQDVRLAGRLFLQVLSGALEDEVGPEVVRERGLEAAKAPLWELLVKATGAEPFPNAGAFLEALKLSDPHFADEPPPALKPETLRKLVLAALAFIVFAVLSALISNALQPKGSLLVRTQPEALVELSGVGDVAEVFLEEKSGVDGFSRFTKIPVGRYLVSVRGDDSVLEGTAEIRDGEMTSVKLVIGDPQGLAGATGAAAAIERTKTEVEELRRKALELLADGSVPRLYALAQASLEEATRVTRTAQPLLQRLAAWEKSRQAFEETLRGAEEADPRLIADQARAESAELMLRLTRAELKAADAEWEAKRSLLGAEGLAAARNAEARYVQLSKLASGRDGLVKLLSDARVAKRSVETQRAEALRSMADVTNKQAFQRAETALAEAEQKLQAAPEPLTVNLAELERRREEFESLRSLWSELKVAWGHLAESASDVNAIRDVVARLSGAIVRKDLGLILKLYEDSGTDRYFFETTLRQAESLRFRAAAAVIDGEDAYADIEEFSYVDTQTKKRIEKQSFRIQLQRVAGRWKINRVRQVAR